jgi:hypothetical protein
VLISRGATLTAARRNAAQSSRLNRMALRAINCMVRALLALFPMNKKNIRIVETLAWVSWGVAPPSRIWLLEHVGCLLSNSAKNWRVW